LWLSWFLCPSRYNISPKMRRSFHHQKFFDFIFSWNQPLAGFIEKRRQIMNRIAIWHYAQFGRNHPVSYCPLRGQLKHQSGLFNTCGDSMLRVVKKPGCCAHHDQELNGFVLPSDITDRLFGWFPFVFFFSTPRGYHIGPPPIKSSLSGRQP